MTALGAKLSSRRTDSRASMHLGNARMLFQKLVFRLQHEFCALTLCGGGLTLLPAPWGWWHGCTCA